MIGARALRALVWGAVLGGSLCAGATAAAAKPVPIMKIPGAQLEPLAWNALDGWADDDHAEAYDTFLASCRAVAKRKPPKASAGPFAPALIEVCRDALAAGPLSRTEAREFFETHFRPVRISKLEEPEGFLTGYYEPIVEGSRVPTREFTVPMHRRPPDLIASGQRRRSAQSTPNKGKVFRRVGKKLVDYHDRAAIEDGALDGRHLEICWLKDPIEAFFIHIQGSARVRLEDGTVLRLNYDAHNGHPYNPVGRILIDRGIVAKEDMSMDRIRQWMLDNPEEGRALRRQNKSYIFFRIAELSDGQEAVGAQGIPLTAWRSIAVDKALHMYGTPFWIDAQLPLRAENSADRFRRLMIAQDTGSAIVGPARADIYFGAGAEAGQAAGRVRHPGTFVMLVPRGADPVAAGEKLPLPPVRPPARR